MCTHGDLGTHPHLGSPSSLPKPDPRPEHILGCGHKLWIPGLELRGWQATSTPYPHTYPSF